MSKPKKKGLLTRLKKVVKRSPKPKAKKKKVEKKLEEIVEAKPVKKAIGHEVKVPNTYGIAKYMDKEDYQKRTEAIQNRAKQIAGSRKWKSHTYELTPEYLIVRKK